MKEAVAIDRRKQQPEQASPDEEVHQLKDRKESHSKASTRQEDRLLEDVEEGVVQGQQQIRKHKRLGGKPV